MEVNDFEIWLIDVTLYHKTGIYYANKKEKERI